MIRIRPLLLILLFCLSIASCGYLQHNDSHLSPGKMSKILLDMQLAEAYSGLVGRDSLHKGNEKNIDSLAHYYKLILAHYKISEQEFSKSLDWYRSNPDILDTAYNDIIPRLTKMQMAAENKKDTTVHK